MKQQSAAEVTAPAANAEPAAEQTAAAEQAATVERLRAAARLDESRSLPEERLESPAGKPPPLLAKRADEPVLQTQPRPVEAADKPPVETLALPAKRTDKPAADTRRLAQVAKPAAEARPLLLERPAGAVSETLAVPVRRWESLVEELRAQPARTPEILAHAAVEAIGPRAKVWADHTRGVYPSASPRALARLAVHRFVRSAGLRGGLGAVAGPYAPIACASATVITHAELVLHLAAAYGVDPADPARADDLLRLAGPGGGPIVAWAALRLVNRALPGVNVLTGVLGVRATTEMVAARAQRFYAEYSSQPSQESGSSS